MQRVIELLTLYKNYQEGHQVDSDDWADFGKWLISNNEKKPKEFKTDQAQVNESGVDAMLGYLLGGIISYAEAWIKLAFRDTALVSLNDFAIVKSVEQLGDPTKKEIKNRTVMEPSTCIESIKRLIRAGILSEKINKEDRRSRRVVLTQKGKKIIKIIDEKMKALSLLLTGELNLEEKNKMLPILHKLNNFHTSLYRSAKKEDIISKYNL